jgi:3D (Asp-Asp-Asp) domain-containing protein
MAPRLIFAAAMLVGCATVVAQSTATKLAVHVTHFGYPGDPQATANTRLGLGDHNNILNPDSVAVTPDLNRVFPFGSKVYIAGKFIGFRHSTLSAKLHHTIAVYDPDGQWTGDSDSYVQLPAKK